MNLIITGTRLPLASRAPSFPNRETSAVVSFRLVLDEIEGRPFTRSVEKLLPISAIQCNRQRAFNFSSQALKSHFEIEMI